MIPPHVLIVEEVLPEIRRRFAVALYRSGTSQEEISSLLGVSQAMVSRYLKADTKIPHSLEEAVSRITRELVVAALAGEDRDELTERLCIQLDSAVSGGMITERYRERWGRDLPMCATGKGAGPGTRARILEDLSTSVRYLMKRPIPDLISALKVNLAIGIDGAEDEADVASFPGRLSDTDGRIQEPRPPEFGVSRHLSRSLLGAMRGNEMVNTVMSLRYDERIEGMLRRNSLAPICLDRDAEGLEDLLRGGTGPDNIVVDPGDFGIEPCMYLFGSSPLEVVSRAVDLQTMLDKEVM